MMGTRHMDCSTQRDHRIPLPRFFGDFSVKRHTLIRVRPHGLACAPHAHSRSGLARGESGRHCSATGILFRFLLPSSGRPSGKGCISPQNFQALYHITCQSVRDIRFSALAKKATVMPRTMLRYAIERFNGNLREAYLKGKI